MMRNTPPQLPALALETAMAQQDTGLGLHGRTMFINTILLTFCLKLALWAGKGFLIMVMKSHASNPGCWQEKKMYILEFASSEKISAQKPNVQPKGWMISSLLKWAFDERKTKCPRYTLWLVEAQLRFSVVNWKMKDNKMSRNHLNRWIPLSFQLEILE